MLTVSLVVQCYIHRICLAILCTKLTVLLLYRRIFLPHRWGVFDIILRVFMAVCSLYYISTIFVKIWECTPRARTWNQSLEGTCVDIASVLNTDGVFNTMSVFFILVVPLNALWKLQMKPKRKTGILLLFTVGLMQVFPPFVFRTSFMTS